MGETSAPLVPRDQGVRVIPCTGCEMVSPGLGVADGKGVRIREMMEMSKRTDVQSSREGKELALQKHSLLLWVPFYR